MTDNKEYKLSIDPRILELLGPSLYTNIYFILAELIANAYDANAKNIYIIQESDQLTVEDDGHGMSYEDGDIATYLNVAQETRTEKSDEFVRGSNKTRKKMGRKGVGKLAALSVSHDVEIKTIKNGEKSGFILSRYVSDDHLLIPISDENINFRKISSQGTAIVMRNPQYQLHRTVKAIKNNLLKIFPLIDSSFKIHVQIGRKKVTIESFEKELIEGLGGLIILGQEYESLSNYFSNGLKNKDQYKNDLLKKRESLKQGMVLTCKNGTRKSFELKISGWIGVYRSTKGRKVDPTDFPDNFISLLSNKKLGEYNILPLVGKNAMTELYVVGQLHVDLFEDTLLPDMALSNRQGYKSDDERYQKVIKVVRNELLPEVVALRVKYASYVKEEKEEEKAKKNKDREIKFLKQIDTFKENSSTAAAEMISRNLNIENSKNDDLKNYIKQAINSGLPDMGIKRTIDSNKKKLLISHCILDKVSCDFIYNLLVFNGIPASEVIYTSSDNPESIIPRKTPVYDYLREFFVESYSSEKIYVIYVTSDLMAGSWSAVSEVGAGWIARSEHDIFNINDHSPKKPLDIDVVWTNIEINPDGKITMPVHEVNRMIEVIVGVTNTLGYKSKSKALIKQELERLVEVEGEFSFH